MNVAGYGMTKACADKVFTEAGFRSGEGRDEVGVVELHDCFASNEASFSRAKDGRSIDKIYRDVVDNIRRSWTLQAWGSTQDG